MNKLFFRLSLLFLIAGIGFVSCNKEDIQTNTEEDFVSNLPVSDVKIITYSDGVSRSKKQMLEFPSIEAYEKTVEMLETQTDKYASKIMSKFQGLDEVKLNEELVKIGYDEQTICLAFENKLGWSVSMRRLYYQLEENWLDKGEFDSESDPDNKYGFDDSEMTLLNVDGEVKVGKSILKLTIDGFVEFTDGSFENLSRYNNGDKSILKHRFVHSNLNFGRNFCSAYKLTSRYENYATNKRVKLRVHFHAYPWKGTSTAKIVSYKKNWRGKWRRYTIALGVNNSSNFLNIDCSTSIAAGVTGWDRKHRQSLNERFYDYWGWEFYRAAEGSVHGSFEYAGNEAQLDL